MNAYYLVLFLFASTALAQSSGTITISATPPSNDTPNSGCIVFAQVASLSGPTTLTAARPICPNTATIPSPNSSVALNWPLTSSGDGSASSIAIYGQITSDSGSSPATAQAGCVMALSQMQAMYLLGRTLEWAKTEPNELYDDTAGGVLLDPTTYQPILCGANANLLPVGLKIPDPYAVDGNDEAWDTPIVLVNSSVLSTSTISSTTTESPSQLSPSPEISPSTTATPSQSALASSSPSISASTSSNSTSPSPSFTPPSSSASFTPTPNVTKAQQNATSVAGVMEPYNSTLTAVANIGTSRAVTSTIQDTTSSSATISPSIIQTNATQGIPNSTDTDSTFSSSQSSEPEQSPSPTPSSVSHNTTSTTLTPSVQTASTYEGNSTLSRRPSVTSSRFSSKSSSLQAIATSVTVSVSGLPPNQSVGAVNHTKALSSASSHSSSLNSTTTTDQHTTIVNVAPSPSVSKSSGKTSPKPTHISKSASNSPPVFTNSKGSTIGQFQPETTSKGTEAPKFNGSSSDVLIEEIQNQITSNHHSLDTGSAGKDRKPGGGGEHGATSKDQVLIAGTTSLRHGVADHRIHHGPFPSSTQRTGLSQLSGNEILNVLSGSSISPTDNQGSSCKRNKKRLNTEGS